MKQKITLNQVQYDKLIETIKEKTKNKMIKVIGQIQETTLTDSKFGGYPYWPKQKCYPKNNHQQNLVLLAQICLEDIHCSYLPQTGFLQFFIDTNDLMGLPLNQQKDGYQVIYHQGNEEIYSIEEMNNLHIYSMKDVHSLADEQFTPLEDEIKLSFYEDEDYINGSLDCFEETILNTIQELFKIEVNDMFKDLDDKQVKDLYEVFGEAGHKMFGTPYFTQWDPRDEGDYPILLLQIDTDSKNKIMWGDVGIGNFFIRKEDLENHNFDDVLYNWDCY